MACQIQLKESNNMDANHSSGIVSREVTLEEKKALATGRGPDLGTADNPHIKFNNLRAACCDLMGAAEYDVRTHEFNVPAEDMDLFEGVVRRLT